MRKFSLGATLSFAAITAAVTVSLTYVYAMNNFNAKVADINQRQAMYSKLSEIDQKVRQDYIGTIDETTLNDAISTGYLAGIGDVNARYLSAERYKAYLDGTGSAQVGIGILTIQDDDGNMEVVEVLPNSAGESCGLQKGDVITAVNGKEVVRISYVEALSYLDGAAGTSVTFTVLRTTAAEDGTETTEQMEFTAVHAEYQRALVHSSVINGNVGYVSISDFQASAVEQFETALDSLRDQGVCGLVIDLRDNSGTNVEAMAKILDKLLPAGNTVISSDKEGKTSVEYTSDASDLALPVSVIVNDGTYSAAEIFAADIQEFKKGLVVGTVTAGHGTEQQVLPLSDGSAIVLSVGSYLRANGEAFTGVGITPDIEISLSKEQEELFDRRSLPSGEDPQVQSAVTALVRQGAQVQEVPGASGTQTGEEDASGEESSAEEESSTVEDSPSEGSETESSSVTESAAS